MMFPVGMNHCITEEVVLHLAGREDLRSLMLGNCIVGRRCLKSVIARVPRPFPVLRTLQARIDVLDTSLLLACLNEASIINLSLTFEENDHTDDGHDIIQQMVRFQNLNCLEVEFDMAFSLSRTDLLLLGKLPLHTLNLFSRDFVLRADDFADQDMFELTMGLPNLRSLRLLVVSSLSDKSLDAIARHCRLLEHCGLLGWFDLIQLEGFDGVAFPKLRQLELYEVFVDETTKFVL